MDTSGSENETCLVVGGLLWQWEASLASSLPLGGQPRQRGTPGLAVLSMQGLRRLLETISSWGVLTRMVKEPDLWRSTG
jgi:hypothetical protein